MTEVFVQPETDAELYVPDDADIEALGDKLPTLHLSNDRKVSPDGWYQEKARRWVPTVPNSFGLPAGETCPGRTEFCNDCYGVESERSKGVAEALQGNYETLLEAGTVDAMAALLTEAVGASQRIADKKKIPSDERTFRIHWDGDFFSRDYAKAWAQTVQEFPGIQFWVYTRSFVEPVDVLPDIVGIPNLAVYLSTDKYNKDAAHEMLARYPDAQLNLAACAENFIEARDLVRDRRAKECPENLGRYALMNPQKHNPSHGEGACVTCKLCPQSKADILFVTDKKNSMQAPLFVEDVPVELIKRPIPLS